MLQFFISKKGDNLKTRVVEVMKMLQVTIETHALVKHNAKARNMTVKDYVKMLAEKDAKGLK